MLGLNMTPADGTRIRALREERGWTQKELAQRVGNIDHSGISNIELGKTPLGRRRAKRFANALGVPLGELWEEEEAVTLASVLDRMEQLAADADEGRRLVVNSLNRLARAIERLERLLDDEVGPTQIPRA